MAQIVLSPTSAWRLRMIGGFALTVDDRPVDLRNRKAQAILIYIALSNPRAQSRERLADALWSESAAQQSRQSLRQTLHDLRQALGDAPDDLVIMRRVDIALSDHLEVDILQLIRTIEEGAPAVEGVDWSALSGALLPEFDEIDPVFHDWLAGRRAALLARLTAALERRMDGAQGEAALPWASALTALDPAHEPACRRMMEHDAEKGDVRAALKRYAALWNLLDEEYATEPSQETQALAVRLKSVETYRAPQAARPALTLCVGEFRLDGVPDSLGYLARGFRQDLVALLTSYREWVVIEPEPGSAAPNVDGVYEVEGVAYPSRDGIRINVTLKETAARRYIWGHQDIDLTLSAWFETCRSTTRRLAAALNVRVSGDRLSRARPGEDTAAPLYDRLLHARDLLNRWTPEDDRLAEAIFRDLLRAQPDFAPARIGVAKLMNSAHIVHPGVRRPRPGESDAVRMAQAAVEADPLDADAQLCLGWSLAMNGRHDEAVAALVAACEANPTDPRKLASASDCLANCGADALALEKARVSHELDLGASRLNWGYRVTSLLWSGAVEEALEAARRSDWAIPLAGGYETVALAMLRRPAEAQQAWRRYAAWLKRRWRGDPEAGETDYLAWFLAAPPIADPGRRALLGEALSPLVRR
jgi:DNA-binding SARP family transcriptional activator